MDTVTAALEEAEAVLGGGRPLSPAKEDGVDIEAELDAELEAYKHSSGGGGGESGAEEAVDPGADVVSAALAAAGAEVGEEAEEKGRGGGRRKEPRDLTVPAVTIGASGQALSAAAQKLKEEQDRVKQRAERFGTKYRPPKLHKVLDRTEQKRLLEQTTPGFVTGFDMTSEEAAAKRAARAAKFGTEVFDYSKARNDFAGKKAEDAAKVESARERARRFGVEYEPDVEIATLAHDAFEADWTADADLLAAAETRYDVIHVRAPGYLRASTDDINHFFAGFGISWIEWLNGVSFNVMFEDRYTAARVLETLSEPLPHVALVPPVADIWRVCVKPIKKLRTDRYAPKGSLTTVFLRHATDMDTKAKAKKAPGPRSHGTVAWKKFFQRQGKALPPPEQLQMPIFGKKKPDKKRKEAPPAAKAGMEFMFVSGPPVAAAGAHAAAAPVPPPPVSAPSEDESPRKRRRGGGSDTEAVAIDDDAQDVADLEALIGNVETPAEVGNSAQLEAELDAALNDA